MYRRNSLLPKTFPQAWVWTLILCRSVCRSIPLHFRERERELTVFDMKFGKLRDLYTKWDHIVFLGRKTQVPLPFCNSVNEADLHSEKLPLGCRAERSLFFSVTKLGESFSSFTLCVYPLGVQGSTGFPLRTDSLAGLNKCDVNYFCR